jgi:hypothetical protein
MNREGLVPVHREDRRAGHLGRFVGPQRELHYEPQPALIRVV